MIIFPVLALGLAGVGVLSGFAMKKAAARRARISSIILGLDPTRSTINDSMSGAAINTRTDRSLKDRSSIHLY